MVVARDPPWLSPGRQKSPDRCPRVLSEIHPAKKRGIFREEYVERLLAAPNDERTRLESNKLWQIGLLELWLQMRGL